MKNRDSEGQWGTGIYAEFRSALGAAGITPLDVSTGSHFPPRDQAEDQGSLEKSSPKSLSGDISEME